MTIRESRLKFPKNVGWMHLSPLLAAALLCIPMYVRADGGTVSTLISAALGHHPSLRVQQSRSSASQAEVEAARWQFWPTPSVAIESATSSASDTSYRGDNLVTNLRLQQPLWTGGRLSGGLARSQARAAMAEADLREVRQQLALRVVQAWSEALVAGLKYKAYVTSRGRHERLLRLVESRRSEGISAQADVALARSRLDTLNAELDATIAQFDTALERLHLLSGQRVGAELVDAFPAQLLPARAPGLAELLIAASEQSPALAKAQSQIKVAETDIQLARAALSPEVYLRLERQYGNHSQGGTAPSNRIFFGVSTALGGGLSSLSGIDAAVAQHQAAQEDLQTQQLALNEQVQADYKLALAAQSRRVGLESARQAAEDVLASYERQFLAGRKQWIDLMNAAREQAQSDIQLADALGAEQLANWRLALLSCGVDAVLEDSLRIDNPRKNQ